MEYTHTDSGTDTASQYSGQKQHFLRDTPSVADGFGFIDPHQSESDEIDQQKNTDTERALVLKLAAYLKDSSYIKNTIRQIETEKKVETQILSLIHISFKLSDSALVRAWTVMPTPNKATTLHTIFFILLIN